MLKLRLSPVRLPIPPPQHEKKINMTAGQVQSGDKSEES